jgi:hypothetical protein
MGKIEVEFERSDPIPIKVTVIKGDSNKEGDNGIYGKADKGNT